MKRKRLDDYLAETYQISKIMAESLILQGLVIVNNQKIIKKNHLIKPDDKVILKKNIQTYPSRSAYKLKYAINQLQINDKIKNKICVDIGASHGGFTKVLLENYPKRVYAIDVAKGIIDYQIRMDQRVYLLEEKNIKDIHIKDFIQEDYLDSPWFITCDVSFISIITVIKALEKWLKQIKQEKNNDFYFNGIFLLKPQFEDSQSTMKGILKDLNIREHIIQTRIKQIKEMNFKVLKHFPSSLKGTKGNLEEILYIRSF
ncbi:MAG: TlyA family rRNA (cytidine-2'-O)-methyltransferase [Leptospiraceae bacterium]|nr:MAG: TlyA family rRNA (cytidine-2'-O)-methyltransferase [Leptospiraceae bacterium]